MKKSAIGLGLVLCCAILLGADEKKDEKKKDPPKILTTIPLAVESGAASTIKIRGLRLDNASGIRFLDAKSPIDAKIKSKGKVELPKGLEAPKAGDTQVEVELKSPADLPAGPLNFVLLTPDGESQSHSLSILPRGSSIEEKEPNGSFRKPQDIELNKIVLGQIAEPMDVDVFRFSGKAGQKIVAEVTAARLGSALDSSLSLYDENGHILASNDDAAGTDSVLRITLPKDGKFLLVLIDANDKGGAAHPYQILISEEK